MSKIALELINTCLETQQKHLDLGHCGLRDLDFESGAPVDIALRKCLHLESLFISDVVYNYAERKWYASRSGEHNYLTKGPAAINQLQQLLLLECASNQGMSWNIEDTFFVSQLYQLQYLNLRGNKIKDIKGLSNLSSLLHLDLIDNKLSDLEGLIPLQHLRNLILTRNKFSDISSLAHLQSLEYLDLTGSETMDLKPLEALGNLKVLELQGNEISNIKSLKNITSLIHLNLDYNPIDHVDDLAGLVNLRVLRLQRTRVTHVENLGKLTLLQSLNLNNNRINKLKGLKNLSNLTDLDVGENYITGLKAIENFTLLERLNLTNNRISELKSIEQLKNLRDLDLSYNKIKDFNSLRFLTKLEKLNLSQTGIKNIEFLLPLTSLKKLFLQKNNLSSIDGLETLENLMELNVSSNKIENITPLFTLTSRPVNPLIIETKTNNQHNWGKIVVTNNPIKKKHISEINGVIEVENQEIKITSSVFRPGIAVQTDRFIRQTYASDKEIIKTHSMIVNQLAKFLSPRYCEAKNNISIEKTILAGNIADILTLEEDGSYILYEVKTDSSARRNIREALGQLLDYASHAGEMVISKMVIVSPAALTAENKLFLDKLRTMILCPIQYLHYIEVDAEETACFHQY